MQHKNKRIFRMLELVKGGSNKCKPGMFIGTEEQETFYHCYQQRFQHWLQTESNIEGDEKEHNIVSLSYKIPYHFGKKYMQTEKR